MKQMRKNREGRMLLWLWLMLGAGCLLIFHSFLWGNEVLVFGDVGADTRDQYIMHYNTIVNHLRSGNFSLWDFSNGFGANMFIMNLTEPFLLPVYLLGVLFGPEHITWYMVYVLILEVLAAGTTCYFFLSEFSLEEPYKLAAAFMYAFNGYLMVWGQHYQLGSVVVWLPLLFWGIERTHRNRRALLGVAATSALLILNGFYQGYMCMLGGGFYVCLRELLYEDAAWKQKWKNFFSLAGAMGFGVLLGAVNLLPAAAAQVGTTDRLHSSLSLWQRLVQNLAPWEQTYYQTLLCRLFGSNLQGSGNGFLGYGNFYEAPNLFFSTLFVVLLFQYLFTIHRQEKKPLQKLAQYLGIALAAFLILVPAGSLLFNGFAYAFSRHTFLLMPLFALLGASTLQNMMRERKISLVGLATAVLAMAAVYGDAYRSLNTAGGRINALVLSLTGLVLAVTSAAPAFFYKINRRFCYHLLLLALFVNMVSDTALCYRDRLTIKKDDDSYYQGTYDSSVTKALAWLKEQDPSFYRLEKDFGTASGCMDAMAQQYAGVSTYNSTQNENVKQFLKKFWPQLGTGYDFSHFKFANSVREQTMGALAGVKYLLSHEAELAVDGYELYQQIDDLYIYRNTEADSIGKFYTRTVTQADYENVADSTDIWKLLREVLIVDEKDALALDEQELQTYREQEIALLDREQWDAGSGTLHFKKKTIQTSGQQEVTLPLLEDELAQYEEAAVEFVLKTDLPTEVEICMNDKSPNVFFHYGKRKRYHFAIPQGTRQIMIRFDNELANVKFSDLSFFGTREKGAFSEAATIQLNARQKDNRLTGEIHATTQGVVLLTIPYESGWQVALNGKEQELIRGDLGFLAFAVEPGDYELEAVYRAPLFAQGLILSLVSWALFVILWFCSLKKVRRKTND